MKKSFFILSMTALIITSLCIYYVKASEREDSKSINIEKAFKASGAEVESSEIYFWGEVDEETDGMPYSAVENIMSSLGVRRDDEFITKESENGEETNTEINGNTGDGKQVRISIHTGKDSSNGKSSYISVSVMQKLAYDKLWGTKDKLLEAFKKYGINPKINLCIIGTYDGKLEKQRLNEISKTVLKEAHAKRIEGVDEKNYLSISAYSPYIERYIKVNNKKVNLNFASRYNSLKDKTYIWLATPVIITEY